MIVEEEEEPDKDQSNRTPPSTPDENAGMGKLEHLDILLNIIVRLPVKSILRFRCVSKAWCKLLKDPQFVREHLNHAIEMNKFSVMILSYGLQYCSDNHTDTYIVAYDPLLSTPSNHPVHINSPSRCEDWATTEFKEVPVLPNELAIDYICCKYAFGYDDEVDDFKVVSFVGWLEENWVVHVYTLKSNSWRRLENISSELCAEDLVMSQVSVNGAPHWLASTGSEGHKVIASFCFKDDRFKEMPLPNVSDEYVETRLCSLGGSLCLLGSIGSRTDLWEMKKYGVAESWAKLFTFPYTSELVSLQFVNNAEVLLGYDTDDSYRLDLFSLKLGTSTNLKAYAKQDSFNATSFVYVESLVALNSGTYVGQVDKDLENDSESEDEDEDSANDTGAKRERPQRWGEYLLLLCLV
ncbi:F-box/kelch-repeat protein At3g06240-like [Papaver somniferum]|uniref:F-box/kelch-repeat protein At3g06240-like n=1 Tax=Papaver somniferum TaxID=3469 RepID=UPI000E6F7714|nr:F-box/kelch-repeat protein At3g06240-like [Papaver somniferum]